jgi:uncharacterized membrane protein YhaH (DUF805 family)
MGKGMYYYLDAIRKYAVFDGRAQRAAYWYFILLNLLISLAIGIVEVIVGIADAETAYGPVSGLYSLFIFLPSTAILARRLHDIGRSGWWILLIFVPIIGLLVLLYWTVKDSEPGENQYGPNPKEGSQLAV